LTRAADAAANRYQPGVTDNEDFIRLLFRLHDESLRDALK
jgi:hypothetical protein